ncbi:MAG: DNA primase [Pseudomonadota bacterium]
MPRFTPEFLDELKSRLRPSDVVGRHVKLKKQGNEWAGLSPFTKEKTPSFFVNDQKGFYHCFSSGKHGDIIKFLQETQRLTFHEAVERLAEEAGLELPRDTPADAARAEKARTLVDACAAAARYFGAMLGRTDGRHAADYLASREVTDDQISAFSIGYAPRGRAGLKDHLINKGFSEQILVDAGLVIKPDDGGASYDRFRNRVMFPIFDVRERVIAFGGRALDADARAKYLNSPETPLFHKGSVLYRYGPARAAAHDDKAAMIVCEGYMDVIALWGAGVKRAVAPLGTALTEDQLALLWRASDEPVLCFDGDKAGTGAAYRAIDRALPMLKPGKSLRFAFLPEGKDPDDLVREAGGGAFRDVLDAAKPLADVLWDRETGAHALDTPERRAALKSDLRTLVKGIADKDVREAYGGEFARRLDETFAPRRKPQSGGDFRAGPASSAGRARGPWRGGQKGSPRGGGGRGFSPPAQPTAELKRRGAPSEWMREAALILAALNHPALIERQEAALFDLDLNDQGLKTLLSEILTAFSANPGLDSAELKSHLTRTRANGALERVVNDAELSKQRFIRPDAEIDEVELGFCNALAHHLFDSTLKQEVARSASMIFTDGDTAWKEAAAAREALINNTKPEDGATTGDDGNSTTLHDALERMRDTIAKKSGR